VPFLRHVACFYWLFCRAPALGVAALLILWVLVDPQSQTGEHASAVTTADQHPNWDLPFTHGLGGWDPESDQRSRVLDACTAGSALWWATAPGATLSTATRPGSRLPDCTDLLLFAPKQSPPLLAV
jgi:hypothetical protein